MSNLKTLQGKVDDAITEFDGILREKFAKRAEKVDFAEWVKLGDPYLPSLRTIVLGLPDAQHEFLGGLSTTQSQT